jgi:hypothetical protein
MYVCPSLHMEQLGCHWTGFHELGIWVFFKKSVEEIQVSLKLDKNYGYFTQWPIHIFFPYLPQFFIQWQISNRSCRENLNTQATITICCMRTACWIPKATHTHGGYLILIAFPLQQWLPECTSVLHYVCIACLVCVTKSLTFWKYITALVF